MYDGYGTKIGYGDSAAAEPTWLAKLLSLTPGQVATAAEMEMKPLDSTSMHVERTPGSFKDTEPHQFRLPHSAALLTALTALIGQLKYWTIERSDGSGKHGWGYLVNVREGELTADSMATLEASLRASDAWTAYTSDGDVHMVSFTQALAAGAATIDLASLTDSITGLTVNGTGMKVVRLKITNSGDNALAVAAGALNGYNLRTADSDIDIDAGDTVDMSFENSQVIAAADSTLDLVGTGTDSSTWTVWLQEQD